MTQSNVEPITTDNPQEAAEQWFASLEKCCSTVDYDSAESIFADDVVSFGTKMDLVSGLDNLRKNQWEGIWGNIKNFKMDLDNVHARGDEHHAWGIVTWTSIGFDGAHEPFYRPGRATVALEKRDGRWLAVHTHLSLYPDTPPRTFGPRP
ncbi:MAG: nuclear transport factor 2 family protein [Chloroflexi bacterium]|nr:nuclear transport factor 2 family protein [Chloroflexota bacterium]MDA1227005.1 nuclear transport factor 2 family protein [Chloroflexota bacterium]